MFFEWKLFKHSILMLYSESHDRWALSLLGLPNLIVLFLMIFDIALIWYLFDHHDTHIFSSVIEGGCVIILSYIALFFWKFRKYTNMVYIISFEIVFTKLIFLCD